MKYTFSDAGNTHTHKHNTCLQVMVILMRGIFKYPNLEHHARKMLKGLGFLAYICGQKIKVLYFLYFNYKAIVSSLIVMTVVYMYLCYFGLM